MKNTAIRSRMRTLAGFAVAAVFAAHAQSAPLEPPATVGELKLAHALRGKEALQAIDRLHGKSLGDAQAYVAHYEKAGLVAMLYVSRPARRSDTRAQIDKMVAGIGAGKTPFFHLKSSERNGTTVYSALGEGQTHYFFSRDADVIWIAADPAVAREAVESVLRAAP
jgi:hypothetical protein